MFPATPRTTRRQLLGDGAAIATAAVLGDTLRPAAVAAQNGHATPAHWNTVQQDADPEIGPHLPRAWDGQGIALLYSPELGRSVAREILVTAYTDGSMRLALCPVSSFESLPTDKGFAAVTVAPDLAQELFQGFFAEAPDDRMPTAAARPPQGRLEPGSERWGEYRWFQERLGRLHTYAKVEEAANLERPALASGTA